MSNANEAASAAIALSAARNTSSKLEKEAILKASVNNRFLKEFLRCVYEPRLNYYMTVKSFMAFVKQTSSKVTLDSDVLGALIVILNSRKLTGNDAKQYVANLYSSFEHDHERELLTMLIDRDVKAGFSSNTINKVWPGLVTDVPYMRCSLPKHAKLKDWPWARGVYSQVKADGMFAAIDHGLFGVTVMSRNGSPFPVDQLGSLADDVVACVPIGNQVHGELLVYGPNGLLPRQESNGILNSILKGGELPEGHRVVYKAWDIIPVEEANAKNKYRVPYSKRWALLQSVVGTQKRSIELIDSTVVKSYEEALAHYKEQLARGEEGTILKHPDMIWEDSTSKHSVKFKLEVVVDLRVVGFNEGAGKNAATFGSLQCESADGKLKCGVSGFDDKTRLWIHENRDQVLNSIVAVKSNCMMEPTNKDYWSLFLPIFIELRSDKKKADTLQQIQDQFESAVEA